MKNVGEKSTRIVSVSGEQFVVWRDRIENVAPHLDPGRPRKLLWWAKRKDAGDMVVSGVGTRRAAMRLLREQVNNE